MAASDDTAYDRTRRDFDELSLEEQASFLVESAASTLARGLETLGREVAREVETTFRCSPSASANDASSSPGPAEPETSQRTAPR